MESRRATLERETAETNITLRLSLDGTGNAEVNTGIPFLDHMLTLFAKHGLFDLEVMAEGDVDVDYHHTVEDVGIVLGHCFNLALGTKESIERYGSFYLPMDETLARVVVDLSGRSFLHFQLPPQANTLMIRDFPLQLVEEFFRGFSNHAQCNLHAEVLYGRDAHHMAEALFKGLARALSQAVRINPRVRGVPSTKNLL